MKCRVGPSVTVCVLIMVAGLAPMVTACERAKPARTVTPPLAAPRVETPVIAQVARVGVTAYPPPPQPTAMAPSAAGAQAAYPVTAQPQTPTTPEGTQVTPESTQVTPESTQALPEPTEPPTAAPSPLPTEEPTATPVVVVTPTALPPTPVPEVIYRVKAGDSLGSIAVLYNTTTGAIMARNGLSASGVIRVGQELIIPATSPETIPVGSTVQHTALAGETLADIARYYRTTPEAILGQNPTLSDPAALVEGTVLMVIVGSQSAARTHVVRAGETLGLIAERYGVTTQALARANGLTDPSRIRVGQTLIVP